MAGLALYHGLGVPMLLGASRKKLIDHISDVPQPEDRVPGSLAAALAGVAQGVQIVRVHDVAATRQALNVWRAAMHGTDKALALRPERLGRRRAARNFGFLRSKAV